MKCFDIEKKTFDYFFNKTENVLRDNNAPPSQQLTYNDYFFKTLYRYIKEYHENINLTLHSQCQYEIRKCVNTMRENYIDTCKQIEADFDRKIQDNNKELEEKYYKCVHLFKKLHIYNIVKDKFKLDVKDYVFDKEYQNKFKVQDIVDECFLGIPWDDKIFQAMSNNFCTLFQKEIQCYEKPNRKIKV